MIRKALKSALKRVIEGTPHIPSARPTGRTRPSQGQAPPPPGAPAEAVEDEDDDGSEVELSPEQLEGWRQAGQAFLVLDIREPHELWSGCLEGSLLIPMNSVPRRLDVLPRDRDIVVACAAGMRSFGVAHYLREQGFPRAWSLMEGVAGGHHAGHPLMQPPTQAGLKLAQAVRLPDGQTGTVQHIQADGSVARVLLDQAGAEGPTILEIPVAEILPPGRAR